MKLSVLDILDSKFKIYTNRHENKNLFPFNSNKGDIISSITVNDNGKIYEPFVKDGKFFSFNKELKNSISKFDRSCKFIQAVDTFYRRVFSRRFFEIRYSYLHPFHCKITDAVVKKARFIFTIDFNDVSCVLLKSNKIPKKEYYKRLKNYNLKNIRLEEGQIIHLIDDR